MPTARKVLLGAVLLLSAAGTGVALISPQTAEAVGNRAKAVADLLAERSPGQRSVAELTKTAKSANESRDTPPAPATEHALGKVFPPQSGPLQPGGLSPFVAPMEGPLSTPPLSLAFGPPGVGGEGPPMASFAPPGGGGVLLPPGGPITSAPPTNSPPTVLPPEVPAVPEPSTWAILIVGLAMCAGALRRSRRASAPPRRACA
jgi:hypothetical protein